MSKLITVVIVLVAVLLVAALVYRRTRVQILPGTLAAATGRGR